MSVNKAITKLLPIEFQVLWEVSKKTKIESADIRRMLQRQVARARSSYRDRQNPDRLIYKLERHGNDGGWGLEKIKQLSRIVFEDKAPTRIDLGQWLSVELELIMPTKNAESAFVSFLRKADLQNSVTIKDDGSVKVNRSCDCDEYETDEDGNDGGLIHASDCTADDDTAYGREIVVTFKEGQWEIIKSICSKLNELGCKVNKSCGLHVHFDMRHMENRRKMGILAQRVAKVVPALRQMLPASRQDNEYCSRVINRHSDSDESRYARYAFVNVKSYDRHQTLEVRGHSGTTDANKIINWIRILRVVMAKPNRSVVNTVQDMLAKFNFDTDLQVYMLARQAKFASVQRQRDDVSSDNHAAETGQRETFTIGSISPAANDAIRAEPQGNGDAADAMRYAYTVTLNGQNFRLSESELSQALNVDTALLARQLGQVQPVQRSEEVA